MTIPADDYAPAVAVVNSARAYSFTYPFAADSDIQVFEIYNTGARFRVPPQNYYIVTFTDPRQPTKEGGTVVITREHPSTVEEVSVERNTLISQTSDWSQDAQFNTRMLEYVLDKSTMILQELAARKCDAQTTTAITQLLVFGSYFAFPAGQLNSALDKLYAIALEIDQSAEDCRGRPDET